MVAITLTRELESAVAQAASEQGTTIEKLALDTLSDRFLGGQNESELPIGPTMADALSEYIGCISTRDKYPNGSILSQNTGKKYGKAMTEKFRKGSV